MQERFHEAQQRLLFDLLRLEGNMASLPAGVSSAMNKFQ
jgi:hypothetical protein